MWCGGTVGTLVANGNRSVLKFSIDEDKALM